MRTLRFKNPFHGIAPISVAVAILLSLAPASGSSAAVLHDEAMDGDAGSESNPLDLGTVGPGTWTIRGSACFFGGACGASDLADAFCFDVPAGHEIVAGVLTVSNVVGPGTFTRFDQWDPACSLVLAVETLGNIGEGTYSLANAPFAGGTRYGPAMFFASGAVSGDSFEYEWTFTVCGVPGTVLHDEATGGDAGDELGPLDLGPLVAGNYTIRGSICVGGGCGVFDAADAYCFEIPEGFEVTSGGVTIYNVVGPGAFARIRGWTSTCTTDGIVESLGDIPAGSYALDLTPYEGGARYGPAMFLHSAGALGDGYDYEWTFAVTPVYDESLSGDAGDEADPFDLGVLSYGVNRIRGSLCFECETVDAEDAYCFRVPGGLRIVSGDVTISNLAGGGVVARLREWNAACELVGTAEDLGSPGVGTHSLSTVPIPWGWYGPGMSSSTNTSYDYEWTLVVGCATEVTSASDPPSTPRGSPLLASPNPFRGRTAVAYSVPVRGPVRVDVYDPAGRLVRTLRDGEQEPGDHEAAWDGRDAAGNLVPSGIYLIAVRGPGLVEATKTVFLR